MRDKFAIPDSGATRHCTGVKKLMPKDKITRYKPPYQVEVANGVLLPVEWEGAMLLPVKGEYADGSTKKVRHRAGNLELQLGLYVPGVNTTKPLALGTATW